MKITVFNGSPRGLSSNTHKIVAPLLAGAAEAGAETKEVFLIEKDIKQCRGCFDCWGKTPGTCVIKDDMKDLIDSYLGSDYIGLATPVYGMYMTGLLKNFTDRLLPLVTPHIQKNEDGTFYHNGRIKRFPQQFFIINSGFPGAHNFDLLKVAMQYFKPMLEIYRNCGEILSSEDDLDSSVKEKITAFKNALRKAGQEIVNEGEVSSATLKQIHMELISDEEYMSGANKSWDEEITKNTTD